MPMFPEMLSTRCLHPSAPLRSAKKVIGWTLEHLCRFGNIRSYGCVLIVDQEISVDDIVYGSPINPSLNPAPSDRRIEIPIHRSEERCVGKEFCCGLVGWL